MILLLREPCIICIVKIYNFDELKLLTISSVPHIIFYYGIHTMTLLYTTTLSAQ